MYHLVRISMMMKIQIKSKFLVLFFNIISAETASESGFSASERFQVLKRNRFYYVNSFVDFWSISLDRINFARTPGTGTRSGFQVQNRSPSNIPNKFHSRELQLILLFSVCRWRSRFGHCRWLWQTKFSN